MKRVQIRFRAEEMAALREIAAAQGCSLPDVVGAARSYLLKSPPEGFVGLCDGALRQQSPQHDSIYDALSTARFRARDEGGHDTRSSD